MCRADGNGQRVDSGIVNKGERFLHGGVQVVFDIVPGCGFPDMADLSLHIRAECVSDFYDLAGFAEVGFGVFGRGVEHDRGKAKRKSLHASLKGQSVVIMQCHRYAGTAGGFPESGGDERERPVRKEHFRRADNNGCTQFFGGGQYAGEQIGIGGVEKTHRIVFLLCFFQQITQTNQHFNFLSCPFRPFCEARKAVSYLRLRPEKAVRPVPRSRRSQEFPDHARRAR